MKKAVFSYDKPESSPGFLLWQTTMTWQRRIKKILDPYQLSHAQFVIMAITFWLHTHHDECSQNLIIRLSKLDKMTVSKSLKKLAAEGYVKRLEHAIDTRVKSVCLTKNGKELISKVIPIIEQADEDFFSYLDKGKRKTIIEILHELVSHSDQ